ncbi:EamA family transporter [Cryptosporangium phraense]|uniref:EamA family transporter n=1 Tax=Cryptosporangium phraense TaxID=2593070 RepID=A0A545AWY4_9ACTN|nr:EamA family transporter [Cryptosporangium phraense]TQS45836.1 EamA family transporter [Cryptosporangium phraense]
MLSNRTLLLTAVAPATWGTTYLVTTELLPPGRPLLAGVLRALPAGLLLLALTRTLPQGHWWWRSLVLGTLNIGAFFALLFVAAYRLPGGVAAIAGALQPLLVAGLATVALGERLRLRTVLAGAAGIAGVTLVVLTAQARPDALGLAAALGGAASMAAGIVLAKRWTSPASPLTTTAWQLIAGGLVLAPLAFVVEGAPPHLSAPAIGGYTYLSIVGTGLAYVLWFRGLAVLPAGSTSFLGLLSPVVAVLAGWLVADQALTPAQAAGVVIALAAVVVATRPEPHPSAAGARALLRWRSGTSVRTRRVPPAGRAPGRRSSGTGAGPRPTPIAP